MRRQRSAKEEAILLITEHIWEKGGTKIDLSNISEKGGKRGKKARSGPLGGLFHHKLWLHKSKGTSRLAVGPARRTH